MELAQQDQNLEEISRLPIPPYALAWDPTVVRPVMLPEKYDTRIAAKYIFYLPSKKIYAVSQRCDGCIETAQACDRALPSCARCVRSKMGCHVNDKSYVILPRPKVQRKGYWTSTSVVQKDNRDRVPSARAAKRPLALEHRQKKQNASGLKLSDPASTKASAARTTPRDPPAVVPSPKQPKVKHTTKTPARGRRKPGKARYLVHKPDTLTWNYVRPPKGVEASPPTVHTEHQKLPPIWAASQKDLLAALPTHPDIFQHHGLGYQGGFIDFLILEGPKWDNDSWTGRGTIQVTRKWRFTRKIAANAANGTPGAKGGSGQTMPVNEQNPSSALGDAHSAPHSQGHERTLCPHLEPLDGCPRCPPEFRDSVQPVHTYLEDADESDDSCSDTSNAISLTQYTSYFPAFGTEGSSAVHDDSIENALPRYELTDPHGVPSQRSREEGRAVQDDRLQCENSSDTSSDDMEPVLIFEDQADHPPDPWRRDIETRREHQRRPSQEHVWHDERSSRREVIWNQEASCRPEHEHLVLPWRREELWRQEHLWRDGGCDVPRARSTSTPSESLVHPEPPDADGAPVDGGSTQGVDKPNELDELPVEAELFRNALRTEDPFRIIVASDSSLLPFALASPCAYAFLGFFAVVKFEIMLPPPAGAESADAVLLKVTLEWRHGGKSVDGSSASTPWWTSLMPSTEQSQFYPVLSDVPLVQCFPDIPSYPSEPCATRARVTYDDGTDESSDDLEAHEVSSPAWHCRGCGKLNVVAPFRSGWSWTCSCGVIGRTGRRQVLCLDALRDPYGLTPPLPVPDAQGHVKHTISAGPVGEEYITYKFVGTDVVLQHIPSMQAHVVAQANGLLEKLQGEVDFEPAGSDAKGAMLIYHVASRKAFLSAPRAAQDVWCFMESMITGRFGLDRGVVRYVRELAELRCTVWLSKGTTKNQEAASGYTLFLSTGASLTLKMYIRKPGEPVKMVPLEMPHGCLLFLHNAHQPINYDVQHTGPAMLLTGRWISYAPKEELQVETLGRV